MERVKKIMIVEDESISAISLRTKLKSLGYEVCELLSTGDQAVKDVKKEKPDLVIMDIVLAGKMDGIAENSARQLYLIEHKTTGEDIGPDADFWPRLRIDRQVMIYTLAARAMDYDVRGTLYNVIRKPTIKQKQTESVQEYAERLVGDIYKRPDFYFQQRLIEHTSGDLDDAAYDLWATAKLIRFCQVNAYWPKDDYACKRWGQCAYFGLCTAGISKFDGDVPRGFVRLKNVNPELSIGEEDHAESTD